MKKMTCLFPVAVQNLIALFLYAASDLEYENEDGEIKKQIPIVVERDDFGAHTGIYCCDSPTFEISYCIESLMYRGMKQFRKDFTNRCPKAKGFATITLSLLHELGHFETFGEEDDLDDYDREAEIDRILTLPKSQRNWAYFKLPEEMAATDWAIEWLSKKENRIAAKNFERAFFKCFAA